MRYITAIMVILLSVSTCFAQVSEEAQFLSAKKAFTDGFYSLAQENIEDFLDKYTGTSHIYEAHLLLGRCFYYQNNFKKSSHEFNIVLNSLAASDLQDDALYWIGEICYKSGDFKKALESYQKIIEGYPASRYLSYAVYSKACAYYRLGFMEDAAAAFSGAALRYPFERIAIDSQFKIGECEYISGEYEKAQTSLKNFIEKYPLSEKVAQSHYLIGDINFMQGRYIDSINSLKRGISISPKARWSILALFRMAQCYSKIKDYGESIKIFEICLKESNDPFIVSNSLLGLVRNYTKIGMVREALNACDGVIAKFPRAEAAAEGCYMKAKILNDEDQLKEAEEVSLRGIDKFASPSKTGKLHYELGRTFIKENKNKEAFLEFKSAIKNLKNETFISSAICEIGNIYLAGGNLDKAMESFDMVLKSYAGTPSADYAQYQIGNIFLAAGKYDQSILAYQSILVNFPKTRLKEKVLFSLGAAYFNKKKFERALQVFDSLIKSSGRAADTADYKFYLANSLYNINRYEEALDLFRWIAKNTVDKAIVSKSQYQTGWCYYKLNRYSDAINAFNVFLNDNPASSLADGALYQSAVILSDEGRTERAIEKFKEFLQKFRLLSTHAEFRETKFRLHSRSAEFPDSDLEKSAYRKIALLEKQLKRAESAIEYFRKALSDENNESNAQTQYEIAELLEGKGALQSAAEGYLKVQHLYSKGAFWSVRAELRAAQIFEKLQDWARAEKLYEKLAEMDVEESAFAKTRLNFLKLKMNK